MRIELSLLQNKIERQILKNGASFEIWFVLFYDFAGLSSLRRMIKKITLTDLRLAGFGMERWVLFCNENETNSLL